MPIIEWPDTLACLDVRETAPGVYTGPNIPMPYRRIFGGQLLAQLVAVAEASAGAKQVKSLHAVFPREGDLDQTPSFEVTPLQDGRSFASRAVRVHQAGRVIAQATVSLHAPEAAALEHQAVDAPAGRPDDAVPADLSMIPWETRSVGGVDLGSRAKGPAASSWWMRTPALEGAADAVAHRALLAHATDLTAIGTALRPHEGLCETDSPERLSTAVTTHTVWWHRPLRLDDWWQLAQTSPVLAGARGFARGDVFDAEGRLAASFAQESLIRERG